MGSGADLEEVKMTIRAILISSPNRRMTVKDLIEEYKVMGNEEIPFRQLNYRSVYDLLLTMPDTVKLIDVNNRNSILEPVTTEETKHVDRLVRCQRPPKRWRRNREGRSRRPSFCIYPPISLFVNNLNTLSEKSEDNGGLLPEFPEKEVPILLICRLVKLLRTNENIQNGGLFTEYHKLYKQRLRPEQFGFLTEERFLDYLRSTFLNVVMDEVDSAPDASPRAALLENAIKKVDSFPPDVCKGNFNLEADPAFENVAEGDRFVVNLGEVYSLDKFYVTFLSKVKLLDNMMTDLNEFYSKHEEKYKMQVSLVSTNLLCVCPYSQNSQWHRARVIIFIDYGTTEIVSIHKLRYLHKDFAKYPPFCAPAKLSGVRPSAGDSYGDHVNREFLRQFGNRDLEAQVVRKTVDCLEMLLYVLDGKCTKAVHEELIAQKLVLPIQDELVLRGTGPISKIIDEIMSRLTTTSKSTPAVSKSPSNVTIPRQPVQSTTFTKRGPLSACMYYPMQMFGCNSYPFGPYNGMPLFMPNAPPSPYPFYPMQNSSYPPYSYAPMQYYRPPRRSTLFRPPPGLSLPSMYPPPSSLPQWSAGANVPSVGPSAGISFPSSKLSVDITRATTYSQDRIESTFTNTASSPSNVDYSSHAAAFSYAPYSPVDQTNQVKDAASFYRSLTKEMIPKRPEELFPIEEERSEDISSVEELENCVPEDEGLKSKCGDLTANPAWLSIRERVAVEKRLKQYLALENDSDDIKDKQEGTPPSPPTFSSIKFDVHAREFIPRAAKPKVTNVVINDPKVLYDVPKASPAIKSIGTKNMKQIRAFVLQHEAVMQY